MDQPSHSASGHESVVSGRPGKPDDRADSPYAWYVLLVLFIVYVFNAMDRTILSILAEDVKKVFALTDTQLGFLQGTAFGIFYALFGYPLGRLLDRSNRTRMLSVALGIWSVMTVVSGLSINYGQLVLSRIGVGVGEASAGPAGFSLIADWFTKKRRGTALGIFISGLFFGMGMSFAIGGAIVARWDALFPGPKPFNLMGWRVVFLAVGVPGALMALWVASLREPRRGLSDDVSHPHETRVWARFLGDVASIIPPLTLIQAARAGRKPLLANLTAAVLAVIGAALFIRLTGDILQWTLIGAGYYAAFSAAQSMKHRDLPTYRLTWGTPAFVMATIGFGAVSMLNVIMAAWTAPLALRTLAIDKGTAGLLLGVTMALGGLVGVIFGGRLSDFLLRYSPSGRIWVGIGSALLTGPFIIAMCHTHSPWVFFLCNIPVSVIGTAWLGAGAATISEMVLPRMRSTATTTYFLASTLIGSGLGPYMVGKVSALTGDLAWGVLSGLIAVPLAAVTLWSCARGMEQAENTKWARAEAAGEPAQSI